jgi:ABC-type bacteriocin/lantibiotic exporter with double-glycine peptidase domain
MAAAYKVIPGIVKISNIVAQVKTHEYTIAEISGEDGTGQLPAKAAGPLAAIEFEGVSFSHKGQPVIAGLGFEIAGSSFIGISGRSGKGKTTFIKLLLGFLEADKGRILVNGQATTATERQAYWHRVSYVQQRPFLLHDTISANVTLSGHNIDEQRLRKVIGQVGLADLVAQSPERLNKLITENGKNISGGQRQRIAIARALYKDADLIILDEPFSELDTTAERLILATLKELAQQGKMIILISHNKSSFDFCTKTYFI